MLIYFLVFIIFCIRLLFLKLSLKNERVIINGGGVEYGKKNSIILTIIHILFYVFCLVEAVIKKPVFDDISLVGIGLLIFSFLMLYYIANSLLKGIWTVKLMVAKNHIYNNHWLFKTFKHPNYYLNIFPELIGLAMLCHAKFSFIVLAPIYLIIIFTRINQENRVLKEIIIPNKF